MSSTGLPPLSGNDLRTARGDAVPEARGAAAPQAAVQESAFPEIAATHRVARAFAKLAHEEPPGILTYVSELLAEDFLRYAPPEASAFTLRAIKDARLGKWKTM